MSVMFFPIRKELSDFIFRILPFSGGDAPNTFIFLSLLPALSWLRDSSNVHEELEEIQNEAEAQKLVPKVSLREICTNPALRIPLVISVMVMIAQQLSGINAVS